MKKKQPSKRGFSALAAEEVPPITATGRYFDEDKAARAVAFCPNFLTLFEGVDDEPPMELTPVWRNAWRQLFGWRDARDGSRWYTTLYIFIPRKNAKTMTTAALCLAFPILEPEKGGQIWIAASTEDQAKILFDFCKKFVEGSPALQQIYRLGAEEIEHVKTGTRIRFMSGKSVGQTGKGPSLFIVDEVQEQRNTKLIDKLRTGRIARKNPLTILQGTAGDEDESEDIYWLKELKRAKAIRDNPELEPRYLPLIYCADEDDDPGSEATWKKANPGYGYNIHPETFANLWLEMKDDPKSRKDFCQYNLNIVQKIASEYIDMKRWESLLADFDERDLKGQICYGGLDLGHSSDMTAFSLIFPKWTPVKYKDDDGRWQVAMHPTFRILVWYFTNKTAIEASKQTTISWEPWIKEKWLFECGDLVQDYGKIRNKIKSICKPFKVQAIGYDPWHADEITKLMATKDKFKMEPVNQYFKVLGVPTVRFKDYVKNADIEHNGNPILVYNLRSARVIEDKHKNIMLAKKHSTGKIDGLAATMNGVKLFLAAPPPPPPFKVYSV